MFRPDSASDSYWRKLCRIPPGLPMGSRVTRGVLLLLQSLFPKRKPHITDNWSKVFPYALWPDRTTHSSVRGYMPIELMTRQTPVTPTEEKIVAWAVLPSESRMSTEDLLAISIRQLQCQAEDVEKVAEKLRKLR